MTTGLDIIIVNFNSREDVLRSVAGLRAAPPVDLRRIYVVDNASTDGTVEAVRAAWPDSDEVNIVALKRNVGFGAGNNVALRLSEAPLVLFLNSDTVVPAGAIDRLVGRLTETGAVAAGPRIVDAGGRPELSFGSMLSPLGELAQVVRGRLARRDDGFSRRVISRHVSRERNVDWVTGACLLARRRAVMEVGLFDERFFMYEEDVDLCAALRSRGGRILFTPAAEIVHRRGQSLRDAPRTRSAHYDASHIAFYQKHAPHWLPVIRWWKRITRPKGEGRGPK